MFLTSRPTAYAVLCVLLFACDSSNSNRSSSGSTSSSSSSSTSSSTRSSNGGGGCGGGSGGSEIGINDVDDAPDRGSGSTAPSEPAPTGQGWQAEETDEGCGRSGLRWILVDEVCGDGEGADPRALETPMFRDGAIVGGHLLAVDGTHLWSLDLSDPLRIARSALATGFGQPLAARAVGSKVYLAAGYDGLVVADATDPSNPKRSASLPLPAAAFDIDLRGTSAYLAIGASGVAAVNVDAAAPTLAQTFAVPGHAAAVFADDANLYVAACTNLSVLDRTTGAVKSTLSFPKINNHLFTAAKDVAVVGDVAFIAAGRQGVVAVNVTNKTAPTVIGRCTINDPSFYASGVRSEGSSLFVAGGEWGVLRIDVANPKVSCTQPLLQAKAPDPPVGCSSDPPWDVVDWDRVWAPPPPGKDPIQVLPDGNRVFAFGDARRVGVRAVDVRNPFDLSLVRRYDEPRTLLGIAAKGTRVAVAGPRGGVFDFDASKILVRTAAADDSDLAKASSVGMLDDGRWVALVDDDVKVEGKATALASSVKALSVSGNRVAMVKSLTGAPTVEVYDPSGTLLGMQPAGITANLPLSIASGPSSLFYAAPESPSSARREVLANSLSSIAATTHDVFDQQDSLDVSLWRARVPRRPLAYSSRGFVEVAVLGNRAGLVLHGPSAKQRVSLPALTYVGVTADDDRAYAIAIDRGLYKSYLITVSLIGVPTIVSFEAFTGAASGVAAANGRVYVSDADGHVRVWSVNGEDVAPLGVVTVEERP
jgi:hypothetical protein